MSTDATAGAPPPEAEPKRIEDAEPAAPAAQEEAPPAPGAGCSTCGGTREVDPGAAPCPDCISLVPRAPGKHAADPGPEAGREVRTMAQIRAAFDTSASDVAWAFRKLARELDDDVKHAGEALDSIRARYAARHGIAA